jgi:type VI secretion system protein ImpA
MMKRMINIDAILTPIQGENPAGEDLRYTLHDEIKEARKEDDPLDRGDWAHEIKKADWDKVITLCVDALVNQTKDLQIAVWLTEALTVTEGFDGFKTGIKIIRNYLDELWEHAYPEIEDGDLEFRIGRLEFLNNALWSRIKSTALTDNSKTSGYSWLKWEESRQVGYDGDTSKAKMRNELVAEGKLTAEEFDSAVARSSKRFYESLDEKLAKCRQEFEKFEQIVDDKFGKDVPRLAELRTALEDCDRLVSKILKEKREAEPTEPQVLPQDEIMQNSSNSEIYEMQEQESVQTTLTSKDATLVDEDLFAVNTISETPSQENALWEKALTSLKSSGFKIALEQLNVAVSTAPSIRTKNRFRLLMAKLCLQAGRPELARPIVEKLYSLIEELNLERWESSQWIAEVLDALYRCLTAGEPASGDLARADELFQKLCILDVTKAMIYKH